MQTIYLSASRFGCSLLLCILCGTLAAQPGNLMFTSQLTGAQEVPAVASAGEGLITVLIRPDRKTMQIQGVVSNLTGPVIAAHLHAGSTGQNGGVIVDLGPVRNGNNFSGELPLTPTLLTQMLTLGIYANVHTSMHQGGEIRGQLIPEADLQFGSLLTGLNEVPAVITTATGFGGVRVILGHDAVQYRIVVRGLSGPITAAHIHESPVGTSGPIVIGLSFVGNTLIGTLPVANLPADFLSKLITNQYYINVHTAANPAGEIRGQLDFSGYLSGSAILNGSQETPPVTTDGIGIGGVVIAPQLDSLIYFVQVDGLSGPATAAHVHKGPAGQAGGVVFALTAIPLATGLYSATVPLDSARLSDFVNGDWYFNVHTASNPAGEIRGQIQSNLRKNYAFELCSAQEVPANNSTAYGAGAISIDQENLSLQYKLAVDGLSAPPTAAHIHTGSAGVNGGILHGLNTPAPTSSGAIAITGADALLVATNGAYVNVHTMNNPGGEIRGQIVRNLLCNASSAVFDPVIEDLQLFPNPVSENLIVRFETREAFSGQLLLFNITGQKVMRLPVEISGTGSQNFTMPTVALQSGTYFIQLQRNGKTVFTERIVKM